MKAQTIPGASVALVDREGILWGAGFGFTDYDRKTPVTRDTCFLICSMSKTFAALAVMRAARDGLVDLDAPITAYLPDFTIRSRFEADPEDKITLRHLLNHTSGIAHEAPIGNGNQPSYGSLAAHAISVGDTWLRFPVGSKWEYSGAGYDLASYILEAQARRPFADYLEEKVLRPLNMPKTTVDKAKIEADLARAIGHASRHAKKIPLASDIPLAGAGGVYSSANDLARFVQFFLNWGATNEGPLLNEESLMAMYAPSAHRNYGLGVYIWRRSLGHGGAGFGFRSEMIWLPEYGIGGLILTNAGDLSVFQNRHREWLNDLMRSMIDRGLARKRDDSPQRPARLDPNAVGAESFQPPHLNTFKPYHESWKQYTGSYEPVRRGWELRAYARIAAALGYNPDRIQVREIDGYLCVNGEPVDEHKPGLFFTAFGACLDFTGPAPAWDYVKLRKRN